MHLSVVVLSPHLQCVIGQRASNHSCSEKQLQPPFPFFPSIPRVSQGLLQVWFSAYTFQVGFYRKRIHCSLLQNGIPKRGRGARYFSWNPFWGQKTFSGDCTCILLPACRTLHEPYQEEGFLPEELVVFPFVGLVSVKLYHWQYRYYDPLKKKKQTKNRQRCGMSE